MSKKYLFLYIIYLSLSINSHPYRAIHIDSIFVIAIYENDTIIQFVDQKNCDPTQNIGIQYLNPGIIIQIKKTEENDFSFIQK